MLIKLILGEATNELTIEEQRADPSLYGRYTDKAGNIYVVKGVPITRDVDRSSDRKLSRDEWIVPSINACYINGLLSCFYEYDHWSSYSHSRENIDFFLFNRAVVYNPKSTSDRKPATLGDFI